jgi:RNA polymerase sigma-70 factor (ECF subfamily)
MTQEIEVIRQVLEGDIESFGRIVERYEKSVVRMIRNMTNNKESYEDIAQDVFITAYKKLASFDPGAVIFRRGFLPSPRTKAQTR